MNKITENLSMRNNNNFYKYWLAKIKGIGDKRKIELLSIFKTPEAIYNANRSSFLKIDGIGEKLVDNIMASKNENFKFPDFDAYMKRGITAAFFMENTYPEKLKNLVDAPYILYSVGTIPSIDDPVVAIVGARDATEFGKQIAYNISGELAKRSIGIISGMAVGIDTYAHIKGHWIQEVLHGQYLDVELIYAIRV